MSLREDAMIVGGGVVLVILAAWYAKKKLDDAIDAAGDMANTAIDWTMHTAEQAAPYVNPASRDNVVYRGVNGIGGAISGEKDWTLGGWIYDVTH